MSRIQATYWFQVGKLYVRNDLLGQSLSFQHGDYSIVVLLPDDQGKFPAWDAADVGVSEPAYSPDRSEEFPAVGVVQVVIEAELPLRAFDFDDSQEKNDAMETLSEFHEKAEGIATVAARDFIDWVRNRTRQTRLGLSGTIPTQPRQAIFTDLDLDRTIPVVYITAVVQQIPVEMALTHEVAADIEQKLGDNEIPSLAESLLNDARSLQLGQARLDMARGVLAAAMACEIGIKARLTELCRPECGPLLDIILERPREVTLQAASLFHLAAQSVVGRSLRDEDRDLYRRVNMLFEMRNAIAHRGAVPDATNARDLIAAAGDAMHWLQTLG
jgi:hypothetical protein